jgi:hypothetical protein
MDYGLQDISRHARDLIATERHLDPYPLAAAFNRGAEIRGLPQADMDWLQAWFHQLMIAHYRQFEDSIAAAERLKRPPIDPR